MRRSLWSGVPPQGGHEALYVGLSRVEMRADAQPITPQADMNAIAPQLRLYVRGPSRAMRQADDVADAPVAARRAKVEFDGSTRDLLGQERICPSASFAIGSAMKFERSPMS
jgi:hypothetical protein